MSSVLQPKLVVQTLLSQYVSFSSVRDGSSRLDHLRALIFANLDLFK